MSIFSVAQLALPVVAALISTLAYGSQFLFRSIEPSPLSINEASTFNILVCCIWVCYYRACFADPGSVPVGWEPHASQNDDSTHPTVRTQPKQRWCRKCNTAKPPRAHHCRSCGRCIPKMDHHCPWTVNCVSYRTFPHFFRFLFCAVISMCQLEYFLYIRMSYIWDRRYLPSYLGPSPTQLVCLFIFIILNSVTLLALLVLLIRNIWVLAANVTTIEGWEIQRHATLVRRAKVLGGYLDGPDGSKIRIVKHEFPYDIGIFSNIQQALGDNPLIWLWPFSASFDNKSHLHFPTNGFEDAGSSWPPPDPDRMPRRIRSLDSQPAFTYEDDLTSNQDHVQAFKQRQQEDYKRINLGGSMFARRTPFNERFDGQRSETTERGQDVPSDSRKIKGEEAWENSEGERLTDFGVDEDVEFYDEEDEIPLSQLLVRRRQGVGRHEDHPVVND